MVLPSILIDLIIHEYIKIVDPGSKIQTFFHVLMLSSFIMNPPSNIECFMRRKNKNNCKICVCFNASVTK